MYVDNLLDVSVHQCVLRVHQGPRSSLMACCPIRQMVFYQERYAKGNNLNDSQDDGAYIQYADNLLLAQRSDPLCGRISPTECMPYGDSVFVSINLSIRLLWLGPGTSPSV